jgi:H+/Cl- antiporter ClcA
MILRYVGIGFLAAAWVGVQPWIHTLFSGFPLSSPIFILGIGALAMLLQRYVLDPRPGSGAYDGLADLFIHIHSPAIPDPPMRWGLRGMISFLLSFFGGVIGPEGGAVELAHAIALRFRSRSARWFEAQRRTDASAALSAGAAAAFGAPFAAVMLAIELGIGGRSIAAALSAIVAFLAMKAVFSPGIAGMESFDVAGNLYGYHFSHWNQWVAVGVLSLLMAGVGILVIRFVRYCQESLLDLFQTQAWMRALCGAVLLFLVAVIYQSGHLPASTLLEQVLWSRKSAGEAGLIFFSELLTLGIVVSAFGTIGVLWPIFALGGVVGYSAIHWAMPAEAGFAVVAGLAGGQRFGVLCWGLLWLVRSWPMN